MDIRKSLAIMLPIMASVAYVVELSFVPLILPNLRSDLGLDVAGLALVFNAYAAAVAVSVLVGGWLGDVMGPLKIFVLGVFLFVAGSLVVALSAQSGTLIIGRVIQGIGGGLFSPLIPVLLAKAAAPRPGRLLVLWGSATGFIAGLAPLVAHSLIGLFSWQLVFFGLAALALPALLLVMTRDQATPEDRKPKSSLRTSLFQPANVWALYGYVTCNYGTIILFLFLLPVTMQDTGFSPLAQAQSLAVFWVVFAVSGVLFRNMVDTRAIWPILILSPVFILLGFTVFLAPMTPASLSAACACVGIGFACGNATSTTLILRFCREGTQSMAASLDISLARLGAVVAVFVLAPLDAITMFWLVALLCLATAICGFIPLIRPRLGSSNTSVDA